ncbi:hypothetical protein GCM10009850_071020 [Nonomuraea monospora]|uniref:Orc1-like AAA ATPase domain-containing protein n=1 Tax=Nonomuraea monospora TaxID=568818 RepID=A0ABN3CQP2_9ACTN
MGTHMWSEQHGRLPGGPGGESFVGREAELGRLDAALAMPGAVPVVLIVGAGGVGKTSLALHWAHRNAGLFPDGQLYVDLRGFDPVAPPVTAQEAVRGFLLSLGADPRTIPASPDAQVALYRSMMSGRRMLVLIDDAASPGHVEPLLPGTASCPVIVTSRRAFTSSRELPPLEGPPSEGPPSEGLALEVLPLEGLSEQEASRLLVRTVGMSRAHVVRDLVPHCAGLPLTLTLVAARVAARPHLPLDALTSELRAAATRQPTRDLTPTETGPSEITPSEIGPSLRVAFDASCLTLADDAKRLFLALGPAPVPDVSLAAAASLAAVPAARTRTLMRLLEAAHLATQHRPGRYRMHDLARRYALQHADPTSSATALRRLTDHYLHTAHRGELTLAPLAQPISMNPPARGVDLTPLTTDDAALEWFDAEHDCLLTLLRWTADHDRNEDTWRIAWSMDEMLRRRGHVHERVQVWQAAVFAAERLGAAGVQCLAYRRLGQAHAQAGDHAAALPALRRALALDDHLRERRRPARSTAVTGHLVG